MFLGERHGADLARIYASLDVFVHAGPFETFGQTLQEAAREWLAGPREWIPAADAGAVAADAEWLPGIGAEAPEPVTD